MIMSLELEEVTEGGFEFLKVSIIPYHTNLINKQERITAGNEVTKVVNIKKTHTREHTIIHIGIDNISFVQVFFRSLYEVSRFTTTFFTKDKVQLIWVTEFIGNKF